MKWGLQDKVKPYKRIKARDLADGGYTIINEENLVSPKESDHLVGLVHGLESGEILELMGDTDELTYGIDAIEYRKFKNEAPRNENNDIMYVCRMYFC